MAAKNTDWSTLRKQSTAIRRRIRELLEHAHARLDSSPAEAIEGAAEMSHELEEWAAEVTRSAESLKRLLDRARPIAEQQIEHFQANLAREIAARGCALHGESSPVIVGGLVHIEPDLSRLQVRVNDVPVRPLDPAYVADAAAGELSRLRRLTAEPTQMLQWLMQAYDQEILASGRARGTQVTTAALLFRVALIRQSAGFRSDPQARHFRDYPRVLFRADLHTLLASGQRQSDGRTLQFAAGSDTNGALFMLVPSLGRTAYVGRIWFEDESA
jgi:hypothetical protein